MLKQCLFKNGRSIIGPKDYKWDAWLKAVHSTKPEPLYINLLNVGSYKSQWFPFGLFSLAVSSMTVSIIDHDL